MTEHLARNARRSVSRRARREAASARPEQQEHGDDPIEQIELQQRLVGHVRALREPYRTTIWLRYFEALSPSTIAERQGIPLKTVKTRLWRGLEMLRARLDGDGAGGRETWMASLTLFAWPQLEGAAAAIGSAPAATKLAAGAGAFAACSEVPSP